MLRAGSIQARCDGQLPAAIYVCHDDDIRNLKEARDLQAVLGADPPPASERRRLLLVLQNQAVTKLRAAQQWMRYDIVEAAIDRSFASTLVDDKADRLAARFKQAYDQSEGKPVSAWHSISHFEKESNRDAADHGAIKARYAGLPAGDVDKALFELASALPEAELQMSRERAALYAMEQRRYRAFMFMMGFRYREHDPQPSSLSKEDWRRTQRINPTLLQKRLSAYELDKDTNIVRITAQALNWTAEQKVG